MVDQDADLLGAPAPKKHSDLIAPKCKILLQELAEELHCINEFDFLTPLCTVHKFFTSLSWCHLQPHNPSVEATPLVANNTGSNTRS